MRVISGMAKGTLLYTLEGKNTRPTLDRVKEALFNIIQQDVSEAQILDLFSGTGALAIEALSRGANLAVMCDKSKEAIKIIQKNIEKTHLQEKAIVIQNDYIKALESLKDKFKFDIIFLDPPYVSNMVQKSLIEITKLDLLKNDGKIIIETDNEDKIIKEINSIENEDTKNKENTKLNVYDLRKYGRAKLIFLNRKG